MIDHVNEKTLVILPTYNESLNIEEVLRKVRKSIPSSSILVVDDGSPDGTADLVSAISNEIGNIQILKRSEKSGLGNACKAGFEWGLDRGYDIFVEMDSDLSHDPVEMPRLIDELRQNKDLVIGSRYIKGGQILKWSVIRRLLSRYGNYYVRFMLRIPIHDATSGYRAYSARILKQIDLSRVKANGYGFQIEMAYRTNQIGGKMFEVPIVFVDRERGDSKMSPFIPMEALFLVTKWSICRLLSKRKKDIGPIDG